MTNLTPGGQPLGAGASVHPGDNPGDSAEAGLAPAGDSAARRAAAGASTSLQPATSRDGSWLAGFAGVAGGSLVLSVFLPLLISCIPADYDMGAGQVVVCYSPNSESVLWEHETSGRVVVYGGGKTQYRRADTGEVVITTLPCVARSGGAR